MNDEWQPPFCWQLGDDYSLGEITRSLLNLQIRFRTWLNRLWLSSPSRPNCTASGRPRCRSRGREMRFVSLRLRLLRERKSRVGRLMRLSSIKLRHAGHKSKPSRGRVAVRRRKSLRIISVPGEFEDCYICGGLDEQATLHEQIRIQREAFDVQRRLSSEEAGVDFVGYDRARATIHRIRYNDVHELKRRLESYESAHADKTLTSLDGDRDSFFGARQSLRGATEEASPTEQTEAPPVSCTANGDGCFQSESSSVRQHPLVPAEGSPEESTPPRPPRRQLARSSTTPRSASIRKLCSMYESGTGFAQDVPSPDDPKATLTVCSGMDSANDDLPSPCDPEAAVAVEAVKQSAAKLQPTIHTQTVAPARASASAARESTATMPAQPAPSVPMPVAAVAVGQLVVADEPCSEPFACLTVALRALSFWSACEPIPLSACS